MSFEDYSIRCQDSGAFLQVTIGELRERLGYQKTRNRVLEEVSRKLTTEELGFFLLAKLDPELNRAPRAEQKIWLYRPNSCCCTKVADSALHPDRYDFSSVLHSIGHH